MDHPASSPLRATQWRSAALLAAAIAALELVLLVVAAVAIFARPFADTVEKAAATEIAAAKVAPKDAKPARANAATLPKHEIPAAKLPRNRTSVLVLNGNGRAGAAGQAAAVVRGLDYILAGTGNAPRLDFHRSIVMYRPGHKGEAHRLAKDVRLKQVSPLDGMTAGDLAGAHLVLIVGG